LLISNKIDWRRMVGASLEVKERDAKKMRGERPFVFTNLKRVWASTPVIRFVETQGLLRTAAS